MAQAAVALKQQSGYERDRTAHEAERARMLRLQRREEERALEASQQKTADGGKVIDAADRFGRGKRRLPAYEQEGESGFGTLEPDLAEVERQDISPIEMEAARGGLYQPGAAAPSSYGDQAFEGESEEELAGGGAESAESADRTEQDAARELRAEKLKSKKEAEVGAGMGIGSVAGVAGEAGGGASEVMAEIKKVERAALNARKVWVMLAGGIGGGSATFAISTFLQWNASAFLSILKLPLDEQWGLPEPKVLWGILVILLDVIVFAALVLVLIILYAATHPIALAWEFITGWLSNLFGVGGAA